MTASRVNTYRIVPQTRFDIPFVIDCTEDFALPARYAISMLGLIAGFVPRFLPRDASEPHCRYGMRSGNAGAARVVLPASTAGHAFLSAKHRYDPARAADAGAGGRTCLSLFPPDDGGTPADADIIASAFFFLSLHEEWSCADRDAFGRFRASDSLLGARDMTARPVVAEYAGALASIVRDAGFPLHRGPRFSGARAAVCMTHDIDYLTKRTPGFAYRELVRHLLLNADARPLPARVTRFREYLGFLRPSRDPYRTSIGMMLGVERARGIGSTWFFKSGATGRHDVRYDVAGAAGREALELVRRGGHEIGLHPSYETRLSADAIATEKRALAEAAGLNPVSVRQHYLRFAYPDTWRHQIAAGFSVDSTLGFAERAGFRNGTCHPFLPFDLENGRVLPIWEVPLVAMDGTFHHYLGLDAVASARALEALTDAVVGAGGVMTALFHNVVNDPHDWPEWDGVFERYAASIDRPDLLRAGLERTVRLWTDSISAGSELAVQKNIMDG